MQPWKWLRLETFVIFNIAFMLAWFNWFTALNPFEPNLLAVSIVLDLWSGCSVGCFLGNAEIWECCRGCWISWWLCLIFVPMPSNLLSKDFRSNFVQKQISCQLRAFLVCLCMRWWGVGYCCMYTIRNWFFLFMDWWLEIEVTGKERYLKGHECLSRIQNIPWYIFMYLTNKPSTQFHCVAANNL